MNYLDYLKQYLRKKECKILEHLFNIVAERAKSNVGVLGFKHL